MVFPGDWADVRPRVRLGVITLAAAASRRMLTCIAIAFTPGIDLAFQRTAGFRTDQPRYAGRQSIAS
jgi:hypothetical protein